jgi:hypothetical protein
MSKCMCPSYSKSLALKFVLQLLQGSDILPSRTPLLNDLLSVLIPRIDHSHVVRTFSKLDHIPLIGPYLIAVQCG